jgi:hypothetical protein
MDRGEISYIELENIVFCPKNAHFRKKWQHTSFQKNLHDWQVLAQNKIQKIITAL